MRKSREEKGMYQDQDRRFKEQLGRVTEQDLRAGTRVLLCTRSRRRCSHNASPR